MTKVGWNLKMQGREDLALPIEFFYARYSHAHMKDKQRIFEQFLDYCKEWEIDINEDYIQEKFAA